MPGDSSWFPGPAMPWQPGCNASAMPRRRLAVGKRRLRQGFIMPIAAGAVQPAVARGSAAGLLARASSRERLMPADARSGAVFERIVVGSDCYFVKHLGFASDWVMRVTGDDVCRQYLIWQAGIMDRFPACIDHSVVSMDLAGAGDDAVLTIVMRDIGGFLIPPGDAVVPADQHAGFISHMAALSAAFWGWDDRIGLTTMAQRIRFFAPDNIAAELVAAEVPTAIAAA